MEEPQQILHTNQNYVVNDFLSETQLERMKGHVKELLTELGEDPNREGLLKLEAVDTLRHQMLRHILKLSLILGYNRLQVPCSILVVVGIDDTLTLLSLYIEKPKRI